MCTVIHRSGIQFFIFRQDSCRHGSLLKRGFRRQKLFCRLYFVPICGSSALLLLFSDLSNEDKMKMAPAFNIHYMSHCCGCSGHDRVSWVSRCDSLACPTCSKHSPGKTARLPDSGLPAGPLQFGKWISCSFPRTKRTLPQPHAQPPRAALPARPTTASAHVGRGRRQV